jgi:hypothetical protein
VRARGQGSTPRKRILPDPAADERSDSTALAVAIGGVMCPVPFVMSAVAVRMAAAPREQARPRKATATIALAVATMLAQAAIIVLLVLGVIP